MPFGRDEAEFVVALKDGQAAGARVETWPPEVQAFMDQHVARCSMKPKTVAPRMPNPDDRGGLADDRENAVASPPKKWK